MCRCVCRCVGVCVCSTCQYLVAAESVGLSSEEQLLEGLPHLWVGQSQQVVCAVSRADQAEVKKD